MSNANAYSYFEQDSRDPLVESAMSADPKTKIRPQQSCLKCRERKVKCDRSIPCHACVIRGLDAECTYTATPEDRAHISQADIIVRLRCEVAQLRGRLNQPREPGQRPSQSKTYRRHPYPSNGYRRRAEDGLSDREGSWCASSPSPSVTMTTSASVTSPESTGSDNGAGSSSSRSVSASASAPASFSYTAMPPHVAELDRPRSETDFSQTISNYEGFAGEMPSGMPRQALVHRVEAMPTAGYDGTTPLEDPYLHNGHHLPMSTSHFADERSIPQNQWTDSHGNMTRSHWPPPLHPYPTQYWSIDPFANANANANPNVNVNTYNAPPLNPPIGDASSRTNFTSDRLSPLMHHIPSSWRGKEKQAVLETLLQTISTCDESQVGQVIHVVRTSSTPEEAVSGICQVLGLGDRR